MTDRTASQAKVHEEEPAPADVSAQPVPRPVGEPVPLGQDNEEMQTEPLSVPDESTVDLARIAWLVTAIAFLSAGVVLMLRGDMGYAGVTFAVALSAAINLF